VSVGLFVMFGVQDGFTVRLLISSAATTVLFIAGLTWSEWRADNRHERYMRRWRASRPKVPPKIR
jgi:hypothetical protein